VHEQVWHGWQHGGPLRVQAECLHCRSCLLLCWGEVAMAKRQLGLQRDKGNLVYSRKPSLNLVAVECG